MPRRSPTRCTLGRRRTLLEISLLRYCTVCAYRRMRPPAHAHHVRSRIPGIVVVLFFRCVGALLSPTNHAGRGIRWLLVAHTVSMFLFVTVATAMGLNLQSSAYINNRDFPETSDSTSPGPLGYKLHTYTSARSVIPNSAFRLNQWLADGLLVSYAPNLSLDCLT